MSKTIRFTPGLDVRAERREAATKRAQRRFPVRATVYNVNESGWDRVEVRA